jgi:tetratricopeptide (TPR) repeat protein
MDFAGSASAQHPLIRIAVIFGLLICCCPAGNGQPRPIDSAIARAKELLAQERWQEIVRLAQATPAPSAELDFYLGTALARLGRWEDARKAFQSGAGLRPSDERFPLELAGVAFKQKLYPEAARYLHRALELAPNDSYANDFLGTVYFLQGNLDAALKYWNRITKPQIAEIRTEPTPRLDSVLLDRTFAFSPVSTLQLADLRTTGARIDALGIFPRYHFDLQAREDGKFDLLFRNLEKNGWGRNKWEGLILLLRGLPWQSINPEFYNLRHHAINLVSMWRWDAEKRRLSAGLSAPLGSKPGREYGIGLDLRNENWNIRDSFSGPAPLLGSLNLRREAIGAQFASVVSGRWNWSAGGELSHRDFRSVFHGVALTDNLLARGYQLKQLTQVGAEIWDRPERRIALNGSLSSEAGRIWSQPGHAFLKIQPSLRFHWFPLSQGDDYEIQHRIRVGRTVGDVPFDELFMLGLNPDGDQWMRGHIATRDGRKGSGPLGRNYFLSNWEADKNVYHNGLINLKLGPFVDTGKVTDSLPGLGSHKWLWDAGTQVKVRMLGFGVALSYGKDLRSGNDAWYLSMLP